ncbi:hypothetical protein H8E77_08495 [bacterium]|nr:hypothetical protein [bacterium]
MRHARNRRISLTICVDFYMEVLFRFLSGSEIETNKEINTQKGDHYLNSFTDSALTGDCHFVRRRPANAPV